jgi:hypothetical protein
MVNFAFAGSALLLPYYMGVMEQLVHLDVVNETTSFGGISGGALISLAGCANANMTSLLAAYQTVQSMCTNGKNSCDQSLSKIEQHVLTDSMLNQGVLAKCGRGRVRVGMTALNPASSGFEDGQALSVNKFIDSQDMRSAFISSSYLSCISGPQPYTYFRGMPMIDGGYKADYPDICPPNGPCVRVSSFVVGSNVADKPWPSLACVPLANSSSFAGQPDTFASSSWPRSNLPNSCTYQFDKFQSPTAPHIFPGKYTKLRYTQEQWQTLSMCFSTDAEVASYMFETGKADTKAWFEQDYPRYQ